MGGGAELLVCVGSDVGADDSIGTVTLVGDVTPGAAMAAPEADGAGKVLPVSGDTAVPTGGRFAELLVGRRVGWCTTLASTLFTGGVVTGGTDTSDGGGGAAAAADPDAGDCAPRAAMIPKNAEVLRPAAKRRAALAG